MATDILFVFIILYMKGHISHNYLNFNNIDEKWCVTNENKYKLF